MTRWNGVVTPWLLAAALVGCTGAKDVAVGDDDDDTTNPGDDDDDTTDTNTTDTQGGGDSGGGGTDGQTLDPVAVGFELIGGLRGDGSIGNYLVDGVEYLPIVVLTFADVDYFSAADAAGQEGHFCTALAVFGSDPAYGGVTPKFKPDQIPTIDGAITYASYETALAVVSDPAQHDCDELVDPEIWGEDAELLVNPFEGAHFGWGFAPMTQYLIDGWSPETVTDFGAGMVASYIAINDADGNWTGVDWSSTILWQMDPTTNEVLVDDAGNFLGVVPADTVPEGGDLPVSFIQSYAFWYQDFPLMDFSNLTDGAP
ncbi:MAG: hypothetical protein ABMA64_10380 [Myxococcota bacterium]